MGHILRIEEGDVWLGDRRFNRDEVRVSTTRNVHPIHRLGYDKPVGREYGDTIVTVRDKQGNILAQQVNASGNIELDEDCPPCN